MGQNNPSDHPRRISQKLSLGLPATAVFKKGLGKSRSWSSSLQASNSCQTGLEQTDHSQAKQHLRFAKKKRPLNKNKQSIPYQGPFDKAKNDQTSPEKPFKNPINTYNHLKPFKKHYRNNPSRRKKNNILKIYQYPPTGGFWKLLNTPKPPETTCWGVQVLKIDVFLLFSARRLTSLLGSWSWITVFLSKTTG